MYWLVMAINNILSDHGISIIPDHDAIMAITTVSIHPEPGEGYDPNIIRNVFLDSYEEI